MSRWVLLPFVLLAVSGCTTIPTEATQVRDYLAPYEESGISSGAILLARGGTIILREGFGKADLGGQSATAETRFRIGSITKSMTWAAVYRLVEEGKLNLDGSVAEILGNSSLPRQVTVRHLLTHQGGVADWSSFSDSSEFSSRASSLQELTEWVASQPLIFAPGEGRSYSNSGYILLARVIEVVSGRPYGDFLSDNLFQPLDMRATQHSVDLQPAGMAVGYITGHQPTPIVRAPEVDPSILVGSGSVVSTVGDLFLWSRSEEANQFPWDRRSRNGRPVNFMGGFVPGFGAWIEHYSEPDLTVIVLTNLNNGAIQKIVADLGAILLGEAYETPPLYRDNPVANNQRDAFSGSWACEGGVEFTIRPAGRGLEILWRHQGPAQPLWAQSDRELFYPQDWASVTLRDQGQTRGLNYQTPGGQPAHCAPTRF